MPFPFIANVKAVKTEGFGSELRVLKEEFNKLVRLVSYMMPGVLTSAPGSKTGTTSAKTWRTEAFTFLARGQTLSKAAIETAMTGFSVAADKQAILVMTIQAGGTIVITKGADQTIGTTVTPLAPDNEIVVGYLTIVTTTATGYVAVTDDLAVGGGIASLTFEDAPVLRTINI